MTKYNLLFLFVIMNFLCMAFVRADSREGGVKEITKDEFIALAVHEYQRRYPGHSYELDEAKFMDGKWITAIWRLPIVPGGFIFILTDIHGKNIEIHGGL